MSGRGKKKKGDKGQKSARSPRHEEHTPSPPPPSSTLRKRAYYDALNNVTMPMLIHLTMLEVFLSILILVSLDVKLFSKEQVGEEIDKLTDEKFRTKLDMTFLGEYCWGSQKNG